MGLQQQLLVILVTVIVGFATLVAFESIDETHVEAAREAIQQEILQALGDAQAYYYKPANMGGGGRTFLNITLTDISLSDTTANGIYSINGQENSLTLVGTSESNELIIEATAEMSPKGSMLISWNL